VNDRDYRPEETHVLNLCRPKQLKPVRHNVLLVLILSGIFFLISTSVCMPVNEAKPPIDYSRLIEFIKAANADTPLYPFAPFEKELDFTVHQLNLSYINNHPGLLKKIRLALNTKELQWKLENFKYRVVFVPETREEYATLYKSYCTDVIDYVLTKTQLKNPFSAITNLNSEKPSVSEINEGITAFIVHNLAKEFVYTYGFYNPQQKKVIIELDHKSFIGEVGSYISTVSQAGDGNFVFVKNNYTIWQNSAENPYTALMVPVEETLHINLRDYTESAIRETLRSGMKPDIDDVTRIVEEWVAVEEAITGGLVNGLLPDFLSNVITEFKPTWIESDLTTKSTMKRYRYLKKGIQIVENLGVIKSIHLYRESPYAFRDLLI
jgi:hypothetical protein